jgi:hypothetical protein
VVFVVFHDAEVTREQMRKTVTKKWTTIIELCRMYTLGGIVPLMLKI